jgi:tRNA threonylcarbamoyladenosine biosynthesis protein TsaE
MEIILQNAAELEAHLPQLMEVFRQSRKIALYGDLGSGKTTLVRAFCTYLGVQEEISSPTFSLINEYSYHEGEIGLALVHHLDLYRLHTLQEALDIGVEDVLADPFFCFIEWPQLIEPLLPADTVKIQLEILGETARRLVIL